MKHPVQEVTFTMTGRHLEVTDGLKQVTQSKLKSLAHHFEYPIKAHVVFETQKDNQRCTITVSSQPRLLFRAHADSKDMYASIEDCFDKLKTQIEKKHGRNRHSVHDKVSKRIRDFKAVGMRPNSHALKALCN